MDAKADAMASMQRQTAIKVATTAADSEQSRRINQNKKADTMASLQRRASVKQAKAAADAEQARRSTESAN